MTKRAGSTKTITQKAPDPNFSECLDRLLDLLNRPGKLDQQFLEGARLIGEYTPSFDVAGLLLSADRGRLVPVGREPFCGALGIASRLRELVTSSRNNFQFRQIRLQRLSHTDPWWQFYEQNREEIERSRIEGVFPLGWDRELTGVLAVRKKDGGLGNFAAESSLIESAVRQLSLGLSRLSLAGSVRDTSFQSRHKSLELETLQDLGLAFSGSLDLEQLTGDLLLRSISILDVNRAAVLLSEDDSSDRGAAGEPVMRLVESFNLDERFLTAIATFGGCRSILDNLRENSPSLVNDPETASLLGARKLMVVPVQYKGELLGAIVVADKESRQEKDPDFAENDLRLLTTMANQAGAAISNARLYRDVLRMKNYNENILSSIANGVITTASDGRIVSFNDSAARIFSMSAARVVGRPAAELFRSMGLEELAGKLEEALASKITFQEMNILAKMKNEAKLVFNISATPLSTDRGSGSGGQVISVENISEGVRVKETLKRYVSGNVVDMILEMGQEVVLGGSLCDVTVLFADIRGFTSMSEQHTPQEVVDLLNSYFDLIIDVVFRYNGTVDKIVGDEIMVLFGAPFAFEDDTARAVGCALEMLRVLDGFNQQRQQRAEFPLRIGIGLNRGPVISGNIGSTKHMDYTVIGYAVNLASRLVDNAREGQILITGSVAGNLDGRFRIRQMESIRVKGKRDPVEIFEVLGRNDE